jgi:hypothetical protein
MKTHRTWLSSPLLILFLGSSVLSGSQDRKPSDQAIPQASSRTDSKTGAERFSLASIDWFQGHWVGEAGGSKIEQVCNKPENGLMTCMFRASENQKTEMLEFVVLAEKDGGVEERIRQFSSDLAEPSNAGVLVLKLVSASPTEIVFENQKIDAVAKRVTVRHTTNDAMDVAIEIVQAGKTGYIRAHWTRSP